MTRRLVVLANDPGTASYGFAVIEAWMVGGQNSRIEFRILEHGLVENTVRTLKDGKATRREVRRYLETMRELIHQYNPNIWAAERFSTRGIKGITIELVCLMLGTVIGHFNHLTFRYYIAAQWKNEAKKKGDLKEFYRAVKPFGVTPHQVDACFIGIYAIHKAAGLKGFEHLPSDIGKMICKAKMGR